MRNPLQNGNAMVSECFWLNESFMTDDLAHAKPFQLYYSIILLKMNGRRILTMEMKFLAGRVVMNLLYVQIFDWVSDTNNLLAVFSWFSQIIPIPTMRPSSKHFSTSLFIFSSKEELYAPILFWNKKSVSAIRNIFILNCLVHIFEQLDESWKSPYF